MKRRIITLGSLLALALGVAGCEKQAPAMPQPKPPLVEVSLPVYREVTDHEDFTGQTEAVKTIDIRARVTGYLDAVHFKHGSEVEEGTLLFEIGPTHYQAEVDRTEGVVAQCEARLKRLHLDHARAERTYATRTITKEQYDLVSGDLAEAEANLKAAKANRKIAYTNLGYCTVEAPISGRVSRPYIDPGNITKADDTILTRIVAQDPMWVYFDIDERTMLRLRRLSQQNQSSSEVKVPVLMGLADEAPDYPHRGELDFRDNRLEPTTGTLRVRGVFSNADRLLSPGLFARVRVPIGEPVLALLVPEPAIGKDQGQKFVYVVNDKDEVEYRPVQVGKLHEGMRVITEGLSPGERVIVNGVQRARPGAKVEVRVVEEGPEVKGQRSAKKELATSLGAK
ncbi:MAG TPA: efflux RND transporter periplasmic adaptor subunit [Pirellulales bacterium]|nr:efflux RND transporter periplasmic adaptor subunit [Pirellulales bacterium]